MVQVDVIVKAVIGGRPDSQLGVRVERQHGVGHHVGRRVTDAVAKLLGRFLVLNLRAHEVTSLAKKGTARQGRSFRL